LIDGKFPGALGARRDGPESAFQRFRSLRKHHGADESRGKRACRHPFGFGIFYRRVEE
jgi:hypothetical protein